MISRFLAIFNLCPPWNQSTCPRYSVLIFSSKWCKFRAECWRAKNYASHSTDGTTVFCSLWSNCASFCRLKKILFRWSMQRPSVDLFLCSYCCRQPVNSDICCHRAPQLLVRGHLMGAKLASAIQMKRNKDVECNPQWRLRASLPKTYGPQAVAATLCYLISY